MICRTAKNETPKKTGRQERMELDGLGVDTSSLATHQEAAVLQSAYLRRKREGRSMSQGELAVYC